ncbi:MAG: hypothetical protein ACRENB_02100 [Gemmatimonadales bacterium]
MSERVVRTARPGSEAASALVPTPERAWRIAWWMGLVFFAVGAVDLLLVWYPPNFGTAEWEFGSSAAMLNGLPVPTLGALLMTASAVALGWSWYFWPGVAVLVLSFLAIVGAGILFGTTFPIALKAVTEPVLLTGIKKAVLKSFLQVGLYSVAYLGALKLLWGWRPKRGK